MHHRKRYYKYTARTLPLKKSMIQATLVIILPLFPLRKTIYDFRKGRNVAELPLRNATSLRSRARESDDQQVQRPYNVRAR